MVANSDFAISEIAISYIASEIKSDFKAYYKGGRKKCRILTEGEATQGYR